MSESIRDGAKVDEEIIESALQDLRFYKHEQTTAVPNNYAVAALRKVADRLRAARAEQLTLLADAWDEGRTPPPSRYGEVISTEAELRVLPRTAKLVDGKGAPWDFGSDSWDEKTRELHLVEGPLKHLPLTITHIPDPGNPYRAELLAATNGGS